MSFITNFTGIDELPQESKSMMKRFVIFSIILAALTGFLPTIFTLHLIDEIGYMRTGQFMAVLLGVQFLIDYPSGTLGDRIGYKWVLFISKVGSGIGLIIFAFANTFSEFLVSAVIFGFSDAQASGALQAWMDNNYKALSGDLDEGRKNYGFTLGRLKSSSDFTMGLFIAIGGLIATFFSRDTVFYVQAIFSFIIALLFVLYLNDYYDSQSNSKANQNGVLDTLSDGIKAAVSKRSITYFLIANAIMISIFSVWAVLVIFPLYFAYTGTDAGASVLRSVIFFINVALSIKLATVAKRIANERLALIWIIHYVISAVGFVLLLEFYPPDYQFSIVSFVMVILVFQLCVGITFPIISTLTQRLTIDMIPSENRNAIYSLIPSLAALIQVIGMPLFGTIIEQFSMSVGIVSICLFGLIGSFLYHKALKYKEIESLNLVERSGVTSTKQSTYLAG